MDSLHKIILQYFPFLNDEVVHNLDVYMDLLLKWNKKFNLVARNIQTKSDLIERHVLDCLQLINHIPNKEAKIFDLGSGAGLPGLVLAINGYKNISLIEINQKKCVFLQEVVSYLNVKADILNCSYKDVKVSSNYIISRAMDSIQNIINSTKHVYTDDTVYILHKGVKYMDEINELRRKWLFKLQLDPNIINNEGMIVKITQIKPI